jgi:membrane protease YdiL (CAAX protease family)
LYFILDGRIRNKIDSYLSISDLTQSSLVIVGLSSGLFALAHLSIQFSWMDFVIYILSGSLLGYLRWITKKLFYPILLHSLVNTTVLWI